MKKKSRSWVTRPRIRCAALVSLLYLAPPGTLAARLPIQEVSTAMVTENRGMRHPKTVTQTIRVSEDLSNQDISLLLRYWRTSAKAVNKGRLSIQVEVLRDTDNDEELEVVHETGRFGRVRARSFEGTVPFLPQLRKGDLLLISIRLRSMPKIPAYEGAYLEAILGED